MIGPSLALRCESAKMARWQHVSIDDDLSAAGCVRNEVQTVEEMLEVNLRSCPQVSAVGQHDVGRAVHERDHRVDARILQRRHSMSAGVPRESSRDGIAAVGVELGMGSPYPTEHHGCAHR